jgi:probable rRNA maturation factor
LQVNRDFLRHDYYTDIITFDLSDGPQAPISGEIYISVDRVRDNAQRLGTTVKEELHRVIFHGALHLCGYKDKKPADAKAMRAAEDRWLSVYLGR